MNTATLATTKPRYGRRFDRWILDRVRRRRGSAELPFTLEYRHVYVMPTRFGFWFGILLAVTALGGAQFQ